VFPFRIGPIESSLSSTSFSTWQVSIPYRSD